MIPANEKEPDEIGTKWCQLCGGNTKYIGGMDYDVDEYACTLCGAVHLFRLTYKKGKVVSSVLESIV